MAVFNNILAGSSGQAVGGGAYEIERSLRFNSSDSAYLSRTPASAGNRKTWTWAGWVKRSNLTDAYNTLFSATAASYFAFQADGTLLWYEGSTLVTAQLFRDASAWYHIVLAYDSTQATASDRIKVYVNGAQVTSFSAANYPAQNTDSTVNSTGEHNIGKITTLAGTYLSAYLTDIHFIDGQALDPTSFGEFDDNGIWQPIAYSGTYGTNGFHLDFADNSTAAALGTDTSGNSNTWTVNNISVAAGVDNDSFVDVPTNGTEEDTGVGGEVRGNYCTWNPLIKFPNLISTPGDLVYSQGNLNARAEGTNAWRPGAGTIPVTSGKWYAEFYVNALSGGANRCQIGINQPSPFALAGATAHSSPQSGHFYDSSGLLWNANISTSGYASYVVADTIGVAVDLDTNQDIKFYKNGSLIATVALNSNITSNGFVFAVDLYQTTEVAANFGQRPFAYTAPSGFKALCTTNLPEPDPNITPPSKVMDVVTYTGTGGARSISGLGFGPDFVWIKNRNVARSHRLFDAVRGATIRLYSDTTGAEGTDATSLTQFNADGFNLEGNAGVNNLNDTYVAWTWDAGSSTVTNTQGSITSTVRANASAGFSIVTYTGNGTNGATVGHGLGVTPGMVIVKRRDTTRNWNVTHKALSANNVLSLNLTDASIPISSTSNGGVGTLDSSSTFTLVNGSVNGINVNESGGTYVAYCFAPVAGYSAFGSYTGNGSADGPFVYTGFRPRWIIIKRTDTTSNWSIIDAERLGYNVDNDALFSNGTSVENTTDLADILSNGFKLRTTASSVNASAGTYIYAAFAEHPFQTARAR